MEAKKSEKQAEAKEGQKKEEKAENQENIVLNL